MDGKPRIPETKHGAGRKDEPRQKRQIHIKNAKLKKKNATKSPNVTSHHPQTVQLTTKYQNLFNLIDNDFISTFCS